MHLFIENNNVCFAVNLDGYFILIRIYKVIYRCRFTVERKF